MRGTIHRARRRDARRSPAAVQVPEALEPRRLMSAQPQVETPVSFKVGDMVADPHREVVYVVDATNNKVLAVDAAAGRTVAHADFDAPVAGVAVSLSGDRLFVAQGAAQEIEVLALPDLRPVKTLATTFPVYHVVHGAHDRLYAPGPDAIYANLRQLDAQTGQELAAPFSDSLYLPLLRTNPEGTRLYTYERFAGGVGDSEQWDISGGGQPALADTFPIYFANSQDLA